MYLEEYKYKAKKKIFEYDISRGLESANNTYGRCVISMNNISPKAYPCISPRSPYYIWDVSHSVKSIGSIDGKIYYTQGTSFYYDGKIIGEVSSEEKNFLNFGQTVLIFPDNKCFDTKTGELTSLVSSVKVKVTFINSDLGVHAIKSDNSAINLATTFYAGQGILISGSGNDMIDGYHYIRAVDRNGGVLYFSNYEFGSADIPSYSCTISNEIPPMDSVCLCQNRVWGVKGRNVYASKVGDPKSFCAYNMNEQCSYKAEYFDTDGFTHIAEYGGSPVIFSDSAVYKVYGNNADNYELDIICRGGGILLDDVFSMAEMDGELYYMSHGVPMRFTGAKAVAVQNFPYKNLRKACGAARKGNYYISCTDENRENKFLVYNTDTGFWYEQNDLWISKMITYNNALYGISTIGAYLLDYEGDVSGDGEYEGRVESQFELDDVFSFGQTLCPERIIVRANVYIGGELNVEILYDRELLWHSVGGISGDGDGIVEIALPKRKCNSFKLKFKCKGDYCIKNIAVECCV